MIIASVAIYYSSASFRKEDFYNRLRNQARSTAKLILNPYAPAPELARLIEQNNPANLQNNRLIILNSLNETLYSSDEKGDIKVTNEILERIRSEVNVNYKQDSFEVLGALFTVQYSSFVVIAAATDAEGHLRLSELRNILITVCLITLLAFFAAGWLFAGRALKPISDVVDKVEDISITSLNLRVPEGNGTDEIGRLAQTFNKMLERLETSFAMQKNFIANASHELRTPLTSINGQIEVLMMRERSSDEYKSALASVLEDIRTLINLSNRLLLIARTSAEGPSSYSKKIRIDEILWQAKEEIKRFNEGYHINIILDNSLTDSDQMIVSGDESLLKVAVTNIIENGCKYSHDKRIDIKFGCNNKMVEITFEDNGIGIEKKDLQKVFEPFYRGSNAISSPGSGIGLSLVNQIIKNHNGTVRISSHIGKGTKVIISLPAISQN